MPNLSVLFRTCRFLLAAAALILMALAGVPGIASAQVVAIVNGDVITGFDIEQRARLIQVSVGKSASRAEVLNELIDEKLKLQLLKRFTMEGIDTDVDNAVANMARRVRLNSQQFFDQLAKSNVMPATLKSRIKAEIVWSQIIRGRFQSSFQFSERELQLKLESRAEAGKTTGYDYTLRPILFIVPRGSPDSAIVARAKEAEALRARFQGCEEGVVQARQLRDVAVRPPVTRSTADLSPQLRDVLEKTEIGKLSTPEVTQQGVEIYALCGKKPSSAENAPGKREVREELASAQFQAHSKRYLKELRSQAMIEYK